MSRPKANEVLKNTLILGLALTLGPKVVEIIPWTIWVANIMYVMASVNLLNSCLEFHDVKSGKV